MNRGFRRIFWLATCAIFLFVTCGCGVTRRRSVDEELARRSTGLTKPGGQRISGYTLVDGRYEKYDGHAWLAGQDSLDLRGKPQYSREAGGGPLDKKVPALRLARADVFELWIEHPRTAGTIILSVTLTGAALLGIAIATKESCPFIYSYDGDDYLFDGEPYGGATMASLERTDWSELEHLAPVKGQYRLRLANEVDETQHTNSVALLVVDHPAAATPVIDPAGRVHAFHSLSPLIAAHDEAGRDLMTWLRQDDHSAWIADLHAFAARDTVFDTRNHITLDFLRPAGGDTVYLIANAGTSQWGSHQIRSLLSLRGNRTPEFYAAINGSPEFHRQFIAWNEREELYVLGVEAKAGDRWVRCGIIPGGGPFISERRAIPLDLSEVAGDTLHLRLNPPIGFWRLNSFHLASGENDARITRVPPVSARDERERDVLPALLADDSAYLDFPTTRNFAEVAFSAPPSAAGATRTVFAVTRGWYEIHLHADGLPDTAALARLTDEPGFAVRHALREFADFERTGKLAWVDPRIVE